MHTKIKELAICIVMMLQMCTFCMAADLVSDRVASVTPENEATGVKKTQEMVITYLSDVSAADKTVTVNGTADNIAAVTDEGTELRINFKGLVEGTRYMVKVDDISEGTDITTFFTTEYQAKSELASFEGAEFRKFYGSHTGGNTSSSKATDSGIEMVTNQSNRRTGCQFTSKEMDFDAKETNTIQIVLTSEVAVDLKLYFSENGSYTDASTYILNLAGGGGDEVFEIKTAENENWKNIIKNFRFTQASGTGNTILIKSMKFISDFKSGIQIGAYEIYENYGTADETVITDGNLTGGTATVAISGIKSQTDKGALLVAVYYKEGKMVDGKCRYVDLSAKEGVYNITLDMETDGTGYIKAFLRKGIKDIAALKPAISTLAE